MYIPRSHDQKIIAHIEDNQPNKQVLLVEGARQVGKTTSIKNALGETKKKKHIINLEKQALVRHDIDQTKEFDDFTNLLNDKFGFKPQDDHVLFIDEAQESLKLGEYVRYMAEDWPRATVILTGSSLARLIKTETRYPVGRVNTLRIHPFSFIEFLRALGKDDLVRTIKESVSGISALRHEHLLTLLDRYLEIGGLPKVVTDFIEGKDFFERRREIIANLEKDFLRLFPENDISIVMDCFKSVASFVGSPSKNSTVVSSPSNAVNSKIRDIFLRLESWCLFLKSPQKGPSPEHSHDYLPKRYMFDVGILRHFRELAVPSIKLLKSISPAQRTPLGGVIENQVAIDLTRSGAELTGWKKSSSGTEIDFVWKRLHREISIVPAEPIECKAALKIKGTHFKGVAEYMNLYELPQGFIVSLAPYEEFKIDNQKKIVNLPLYCTSAFFSV